MTVKIKKLFHLIVLLVLIEYPGFAQLKGSFCDSRGFTSTCINFINDSEFEYEFDDCISSCKGAGTYKLSNKELTLNFNKPKSEPKVCSTKISTSESTIDSVNFDVFVFDKLYQTPIAFASVILKNKEEKFIGGKSADITGKTKFSFPRSIDTVSLSIPYVGYQSCATPLVLNKNYNIEIGLAIELREWIEPGVSWKWKIKSFKETGFSLKDERKSTFIKAKRFNFSQ